MHSSWNNAKKYVIQLLPIFLFKLIFKSKILKKSIDVKRWVYSGRQLKFILPLVNDLNVLKDIIKHQKIDEEIFEVLKSKTLFSLRDTLIWRAIVDNKYFHPFLTKHFKDIPTVLHRHIFENHLNVFTEAQLYHIIKHFDLDIFTLGLILKNFKFSNECLETMFGLNDKIVRAIVMFHPLEYKVIRSKYEKIKKVEKYIEYIVHNKKSFEPEFLLKFDTYFTKKIWEKILMDKDLNKEYLKKRLDEKSYKWYIDSLD